MPVSEWCGCYTAVYRGRVMSGCGQARLTWLRLGRGPGEGISLYLSCRCCCSLPPPLILLRTSEHFFSFSSLFVNELLWLPAADKSWRVYLFAGFIIFVRKNWNLASVVDDGSRVDIHHTWHRIDSPSQHLIKDAARRCRKGFTVPAKPEPI